MLLHIPNILTLLRIILIPVLAVVYYLPLAAREEWICGIFVVAAVTDWLDGFLARRMNAASALGAFLDPVADKLIISTALVLLASDQRIVGMALHPIPFAMAVATIIGREIAISALREWMAELGERGAVAVGSLGQVKTATQMIAISLLLLAKPLWLLPTFRLGELMLYVAATLTLWSMYGYLRAARPYLSEGD